MRDQAAHLAAIETAIARNLPDLLAYAERRLPSPAEASDALGDALEIIWRKSSKVPREDTPARMYMFVVLRNVMLNARRGAARRDAATIRLREVLEAGRRAGADEVRRSDIALDVEAAISALPAAQAELVRLIRWDGFAITEAAEIMGVNASTARSRYAAARLALRERLTTASADRRR